jgi:hypothetical protein
VALGRLGLGLGGWGLARHLAQLADAADDLFDWAVLGELEVVDDCAVA